MQQSNNRLNLLILLTASFMYSCATKRSSMKIKEEEMRPFSQRFLAGQTWESECKGIRLYKKNFGKTVQIAFIKIKNKNAYQTTVQEWYHNSGHCGKMTSSSHIAFVVQYEGRLDIEEYFKVQESDHIDKSKNTIFIKGSKGVNSHFSIDQTTIKVHDKSLVEVLTKKIHDFDESKIGYEVAFDTTNKFNIGSMFQKEKKLHIGAKSCKPNKHGFCKVKSLQSIVFLPIVISSSKTEEKH